MSKPGYISISLPDNLESDLSTIKDIEWPTIKVSRVQVITFLIKHYLESSKKC